MASAKVRIYELAKVLGLSNKALMDMIQGEFGVEVKSHSSSIEQELADRITAKVSGKASPAVKKPETKAPEGKPAESKPAQAPTAKVTPVAPAPQVHRAPQGAQPSQQVHRAPQGAQPAQQVHRAPQGAQPAQQVPRAPQGAQPGQQVHRAPQAAQPGQQVHRAPQGAQPGQQVHRAPQQGAQPLRPGQSAAPAATIQAAPPTKPQQAPSQKGKPQRRPQPAPQAQPKPEVPEEPEAPIVIQLGDALTIDELAQKMGKRQTELIRHLFMKGVMVTVNQTMQLEDAKALAIEMGYEVEAPEEQDEILETAPELKIRQAKGNHLRHRAPVVSIMGHVDHGKTSLLDAIRETRHKIVDTEAGGITQSIGAYTVMKDDNRIVFIDTPGHEAFTAMRMRGAQATDIAILVVAADDGVMPQTIEAINHAKSANIPIIVAVNKIDKPNADPDRVMSQLTEYGLTVEKWGGDTLAVEVSALEKLGLDELLENILLVAELQELKADPTIPAEGVVIEAFLDKGKGPVATVLIQNGTLHVGENLLMRGGIGGRIRALISDSGERIKSAGPSTPVEILGMNQVPVAGDSFVVVRNDKEFKRLLQQYQVQEREQRITSRHATPGLMTERGDGQRETFNVIVKADTQGSLEAVTAGILQLATEEVSVKLIHSGTGDVSEADVMLASASDSLIVAFNVKEESNAQKTAQDQGLQVCFYDVIYHMTEDIEKRMLGLLSPDLEEEQLGMAEVRQLFSFGKTSIAGCYVHEGKLLRNALSRVYRNNKEIFKGNLNNLKRFKEDAREVAAGYECGISFDRFNDLTVGDIIKVYAIKEVERTSL